jgi:hypothetical protein
MPLAMAVEMKGSRSDEVKDEKERGKLMLSRLV